MRVELFLSHFSGIDFYVKFIKISNPHSSKRPKQIMQLVMLGFVFTRARAIESRTTQLARDSSSQTLVHVASQVMASQTCDLPSQTRPSNRAFTLIQKKNKPRKRRQFIYMHIK